MLKKAGSRLWSANMNAINSIKGNILNGSKKINIWKVLFFKETLGYCILVTIYVISLNVTINVINLNACLTIIITFLIYWEFYLLFLFIIEAFLLILDTSISFMSNFIILFGSHLDLSVIKIFFFRYCRLRKVFALELCITAWHFKKC